LLALKHPPPSVQTFIGVGANLGNCRAIFSQATRDLSQLMHTQILATSPLYRSAPQDATGPDFLNAVVALNTGLSALELLTQLQRIELAHGRTRAYRNAPRTLDLDLLLYGEHCIHTPTLTVPHPRLHERAFALLPLFDLAPDLVIPGIGPVQTLLAGVASQSIAQVPRH
jgi:2-amino-4-hydroxy-6-hydroxymethyldihydropteridine diphosphokinase